MSGMSKGGGSYLSWEEIYGQRVGFLRSCETGRIGSLQEVEEAVRFRLTQIADELKGEDATDGMEGEEEALEWILRVIEGPRR